jgi:hypothetical protein
MGRTTIQELAAAGYIKIASIRQAGRRRAIHLVNLPSLLSYLNRVAETK